MWSLHLCCLGGPGSNKAQLIKRILRRIKEWSHISMGELLRGAVDSRQFTIEEAEKIRDTIAAGKMTDDVRVHLNKFIILIIKNSLKLNSFFRKSWRSFLIKPCWPTSISVELFSTDIPAHCRSLSGSKIRWKNLTRTYWKEWHHNITCLLFKE